MVDPKRHAEFHDRQTKAFDGLLKALCSCVPQGWRSALLELDVAHNPLTSRRAIKHRLRNPDTGAAVEEFPEALFLATTELHTVFSAYDQVWRRSTVTLTFDQNGRMREAKATYNYGS